MLTELEERLADVLGSRLPAPFAGRVRRRGADGPGGSGPVVRLGVDAVEPLEPDVGSVRPEVVPGSGDHRRVVRLAVTMGLDVVAGGGGGRSEELLGVDALVYELQDPRMRRAELLVSPGDQGFALDRLVLGASDLTAERDLLVHGEGWFWPVGVAGETGRPIERAIVRELRLPVQLALGATPRAGGPDVGLELRVGSTGAMELTAATATGSPFGGLALRLRDDRGGPGAGALTGGLAGPDGHHVVDLATGVAAVTYRPPGAAGTDHLVVSAHVRDSGGGERVGLELARFDLVVES